jgi:hypothetical protein
LPPLFGVVELGLDMDLGSFSKPIWISCKFFFFDPSLAGLPRMEGLVVVTCRLFLAGGVVDDTCKFSLVIRTSKLLTPFVVCYSKLTRTIAIGSKMVGTLGTIIVVKIVAITFVVTCTTTTFAVTSTFVAIQIGRPRLLGGLKFISLATR